MFDKRWVAGTNVVARVRSDNERNLLPGDGRAVYAGIEMRL